LKVTDDVSSCYKNASYVINEPAAVVVSEVLAAHKDVTCIGGSDGSITVSAVGGGGNYEYSFEGAAYADDLLFNNLTEGTYTIDVRDKDLPTCLGNQISVVVADGIDVVISSAAVNNANCNNTATGSIDINVSGGTSYSYKWSNGTDLQDAVSLIIGDYKVVVTEIASGCKDSATFTISEPTLLAVAEKLAAHKDLSCLGCNDGEFALTRSGGSGNYEFAIDGGAFTEDSLFTALAPKVYSIVMRDKNATACETAAINIEIKDYVTSIGSSDINISLYPNPTSGLIYISIDGLPVNVRVYDTKGILIADKKQVLVVDISSAPKGIYMFLIDGIPVLVEKQ